MRRDRAARRQECTDDGLDRRRRCELGGADGLQARGATYAIGTPGHSWQLTAQGKAAAAHKGLVHVAKVMACTAVDVLQDDLLLARAKADHQARVGRTPYVCPLPDELDPPLKMSA